jgi:hypothetical protein
VVRAKETFENNRHVKQTKQSETVETGLAALVGGLANTHRRTKHVGSAACAPIRGLSGGAGCRPLPAVMSTSSGKAEPATKPAGSRPPRNLIGGAHSALLDFLDALLEAAQTSFTKLADFFSDKVLGGRTGCAALRLLLPIMV